MKNTTLTAVSLLSVLVFLAVASDIAVRGADFRPLYEPGMVRTGRNLRAPLEPPPQPSDPNLWMVEPDIKLYHFAMGQGRPVLIVHGGPGRPQLKPWAGLAPLTNTCRFIYYDQRGCGRSTRPIDRWDAQNYYQNMLQLDRALGLGAQVADLERIRRIMREEKLVLIGHSFGGFLASLYAAEFPEHVAAMVLVAPADVLVAPSAGGGLFGAVRARLRQDQRGDYDRWLQRYFDFQSIFSKCETDLVALNNEFGRYYRMAAPTSFPESGNPGGWITHAIYFSMGREYDYSRILKNVSAPILVIHGDHDLQSEEASHAYVRAFPTAQFHVIQNAGHFPFHTQPAEFGLAVAEFLSRSGGIP